MTERRCADCAHWQSTGEGEGETGLCRRLPPSPILRSQIALAVKGGAWDALWPETDADDWCSEFSARPKRKALRTVERLEGGPPS